MFINFSILRCYEIHPPNMWPRAPRLPRNSPMILLRASPSYTSGLYENSVWAREVSNNLSWRPSRWHLHTKGAAGQRRRQSANIAFIHQQGGWYAHCIRNHYWDWLRDMLPSSNQAKIVICTILVSILLLTVLLLAFVVPVKVGGRTITSEGKY